VQMATIGKVVAPHGTRGEVRVFPYSDFISRCHRLKTVWLAGGKDSVPREVTVEAASIHRNLWVLKLSGIEDRNAAEDLRSCLVKIPIDERVELPEGRYYFDQILGLQVYETVGSLLGRVVDILQPGGNDVYVVEGETGKRLLLPAVKEVVKEIDLLQGRMLVDLPPGLKEI